MLVVVVGRPRDRARVRAQLTAQGITVADEFETLADARAAETRADAIVLAEDPAGGRHLATDTGDRIAEPLTPRELEVLVLLTEGLPNKAIADRLGVSDQTIKFHIASILGKLGAGNRTEAVRLALRRGLVDL